MDFGYSDKVKALQEQLTQFMEREIVPRDREWHQLTEAGTFPPPFCKDIKAKARAMGTVNTSLPARGMG